MSFHTGIANITNVTAFTEKIGQFSLEEARVVLEPLIIFVIGMVIYSIFIFKFYKLISRKDIFRVRTAKGRPGGSKIVYALKYIILFPIVAFIWLFVIATLLSVLSQVLAIGDIFLIAMALTATIRLTAYYEEELARDIAKLVPFALLAFFLLDISAVSLSVPLLVLQRLPEVANLLVFFFLFIFALEIILRGIWHLKGGGAEEVRESRARETSK